MKNDTIIKEVKVTYQLRLGKFINKDGQAVEYEYTYCPETESKVKLTPLEKKCLGLSTNK